MSDHSKPHHKDTPLQQQDFQMDITGQYRAPIRRVIAEGIKISAEIERRDKGESVTLLNSKTDFNQPGQVRVKVTKESDY